MASRLATILEKEYKKKGLVSGLASATGKRALEMIDIRNVMFRGDGMGSIIGRKLFGKGYSATRGGQKTNTSPVENLSTLSTSTSSAVLESISISSKISAKNSTVLPSMARDMFLMKQNIIKLVKLQGGTPQLKAGDWFSRQAARENAFESKFGKTSPTSVKSVEKNQDKKTMFETIVGAFGTILSGVFDVIKFLATKVVDLITSIGTLIVEMRILRGVGGAGDVLDSIPGTPGGIPEGGKPKRAPKGKLKLGKVGGYGTVAAAALGITGLIDTSVTPKDVEFPGVKETTGHLKGLYDMGSSPTRVNRFAKEGESISQEKAMSYFVNKGLTPEQAAGIVGNLMQESKLNSSAWNEKERAYGIAQWRNERLEGLKMFAAARGKEISDISTQMDYILHELGTSEKRAGEALLSSKTPQEAAFNFAKYYERPSSIEHTRIAYAEQAYGKRDKNLPFTTQVSPAKNTGDLINQSSFDNAMSKTLDKGEQVVVINDNSQTNNNQKTSGGGTTASPWNENAYKIFADRAIGF